MSFTLAPYFHPTMVIFVDDDESFLKSLDLELPTHWAYRLFAEPERALEFLNHPPPLAPLVDRSFVHSRDRTSNRSMTLDITIIEQEINHLVRFARNSVVMVDYSMPLMNGPEFCSELTDPYIQKAMLTGVADEKIAVQAFNAKLINRFIPKNTSHSISDILAFSEELQHDYFTQHTATLINTLALDPPLFLLDRDVARAIRRVMQKHNIVEDYLIDDPTGFLMLRADGSAIRILVFGPKDIHRSVADAEKLGVADDILLAVPQGCVLMSYTDAPEDYSAGDYPWADNLVAAESVKDAE
ncbi:MAG: response regulator [Gammaproteobacteria bacterium]|nr:response regulator [Gammaproteobacteria bacterium]